MNLAIHDSLPVRKARSVAPDGRENQQLKKARSGAQVPPPPGLDPSQALDATVRPAGTGEVMVLLRKANELHLALHGLEHGIELLGLLDGAAQVPLGVKDQKRRRYP